MPEPGKGRTARCPLVTPPPLALSLLPWGPGGVSAPTGPWGCLWSHGTLGVSLFLWCPGGEQPFRGPPSQTLRLVFLVFSAVSQRGSCSRFQGAPAGAVSLVGAVQRQLFCNSPARPFQNQAASVHQPQRSG